MPHFPPETVVSAAREYVGTPYHHGGRVKGVGVDCIGLLICVARDLGVQVEDEVYGKNADQFDLMVCSIARHCDQVDDPEAGDVVVFRYRDMFNHCAILTDGGMIHAYGSPSAMKVVEHRYDESWRKRAVAFYRLRSA